MFQPVQIVYKYHFSVMFKLILIILGKSSDNNYWYLKFSILIKKFMSSIASQNTDVI